MSDDFAERQRALALELLLRHDGAERVDHLPCARLIVISPSARADEPVYVTIEWASGTVEHAIPGSTLWRATLERRLAEPSRGPADDLLRGQIEHSLSRFPTLDSWWHWLRTGWTQPPRPEGQTDYARRRERRAWWWPW